MRRAAAVLIGALGGAAFVLVVGVLEIHATGARAGAVYDLRNVVVGITQPAVPWLQLAAIALLSASIVLLGVLTLRKGSQRLTAVCIASFVLVCLVLIGWAMVALSQEVDASRVSSGVAEGVRGWVEKGGQHAAVHVVVLVAVGLLLRPSARQQELKPQQD